MSRERYLHEVRYRGGGRDNDIESCVGFDENFHNRLRFATKCPISSHYRRYFLIYSTSNDGVGTIAKFVQRRSITLTTNPGDNWFRVRTEAIANSPGSSSKITTRFCPRYARRDPQLHSHL